MISWLIRQKHLQIADYEQALKFDPNHTAAKDNLARLKGQP